MNRIITITLFLLIIVAVPNLILSQKIDLNLWYFNKKRDILNDHNSLISPIPKRVIDISSTALPDFLNSSMLFTSYTGIFTSFELLESSLSITAPVYLNLSQNEGIISRQVMAHILFKAFDDYYISFYSHYGHHIDNRNMKDNLCLGFYGLGLERDLTDMISMSVSFSKSYSSNSSFWDSKYRHDQLLDLMLKLIF